MHRTKALTISASDMPVGNEVIRRTVYERKRIIATYFALVGVPVAVSAIVLFTVGRHSKNTHTFTGLQSPVARLLLALGLVLVATRLMGTLASKLGQPTVIGELLAGLLLGPTLFGKLFAPASKWLFTPAAIAGLDSLAQLAVVIFIFGVGMALPLHHLRDIGTKAVVIGHAAFALPFAMGVGFAAIFGYLRPSGIGFTAFAAFCGVTLSVTALPVLARILNERDLDQTKLGTLGLAAGGVIDVTAWVILGAIVTFSGIHPSGFALKLGLTVLFGVFIFTVMRPMLEWAIAMSRGSTPIIATVALAAVLGSAAVTDLLGLHTIFGAFAAGLAMPRTTLLDTALRGVHAFTDHIGLPVFFAVIGLSTNVRALANFSGLAMIVAVTGIAIVGKVGGAALAARGLGLQKKPALAIGAMMNCRGLTELVILNVGLSLGLIGKDLFAALVLMALITTAATGPLLRWFAPRSSPVTATKEVASAL